MTTYNQDIAMYQGEDKDFPLYITDDTGLAKNLTGSSILWEVLNRNTGEVLFNKTTASGVLLADPANGLCVIQLNPIDTQTIEPANWYYHRATVTDSLGDVSVVTVGNMSIDSVKQSNLGYLIPQLRLTLGDTVPATYRYLDEWLLISIQSAIKALGSWWRYKYNIDADGDVYRSPYITFTISEPPIIYQEDERAIIVRAAIIILEGSLENSAWSTVSWRDNEISFSNLESGRMKSANLRRLWEELLSLLTPPSKKLARAIKGSLPGYLENTWETGKTD